MVDIPEIPKKVYPIIGGIIVLWALIANGTLGSTTETIVNAGDTVIESGKTLCEAKDMVMEELLETAYDDAPEQAKKILDRFKAGKELTECDYFQLYNTLNKKHIRNWLLDESCNALVCSGL